MLSEVEVSQKPDVNLKVKWISHLTIQFKIILYFKSIHYF